MRKLIYFLLFIFCFSTSSSAQSFLTPSDSLNKKRLIGVSATGAAAWAGSISALYFVWYKDFPKSKFHTFDDSHEWQQMDKVGHMYSSWQFGRFVGDLYEWTGLDHKKSSLIGAGFSIGYMTTFELLDATNEQWGFSWSDVGFNTLGTLTYWSQEYFWNEQYCHFKFSAHDSGLAQYRPNVLGNSFASKLLKDYNGQTYWMSFNPISWFKEDSKIPKWLNLSLGYSINNQLLGDGGTYVVASEQLSFTPYRQYFLSLDVNFEAIKTDKRWLKLIFRGLNFIKVPFPALELSQGKLGFRPFYF
ncbi:MAG: hypothetical protein BM555_01790 [Crocinitomix sp. MedPE-SWsnd]|nr:MAG: hypothetical protein BM555_01790 [Crocinitomix sp. MedPE-SWsnd]